MDGSTSILRKSAESKVAQEECKTAFAKIRLIAWFFLFVVPRVELAKMAFLSICLVVSGICIPIIFKIQMDYIIPARDLVQFGYSCLYLLLLSLGISVFRSQLKYLQSSARDLVEQRLLVEKARKGLLSDQKMRQEESQSLEKLNTVDLYRVSELLGNEPGQLLVGIVQLALISLCFFNSLGSIAFTIVGIFFVLKILNFYLVNYESTLTYGKTQKFSQYVEADAKMRSMSRSLFGLKIFNSLFHTMQKHIQDYYDAGKVLRIRQLFLDFALFCSNELIYVVSFIYVGYQTYLGIFSFGEYIFIVTMLLQLQEPIRLVIDAITGFVKNKYFLSDVAKLFQTQDRPENTGDLLLAHPKLRLPCQVSILGPSGSGKTTMILNQLRIWNRGGGTQVSYVPQDISLMNLMCKDFFVDLPRERTKLLLRALGVESLLDSPVGMDQFSGGEKRRLCIARAILLDSEVTVIDEPESGLDEDAKQVLMRTLATEFSGKSRSLVLITHDIRFSQLTNQIIEMGGACAVKAG